MAPAGAVEGALYTRKAPQRKGDRAACAPAADWRASCRTGSKPVDSPFGRGISGFGRAMLQHLGTGGLVRGMEATRDTVNYAAPAKIRLDPQLMVALDVLRAFAAIYVAVFHVIGESMTGVAGFFLSFGQEAVMLFFLLSGFVIHANERNRLHQPLRFYGRRIRRIYPAMLGAMGVAALLFWADGTLAERFSMHDLTFTLLGMQDSSVMKPGVISNSFLHNYPLWSLSYELWFYLLYPAVMWAWVRAPKLTNHMVGLASCVCYVLYVLAPNHFTLVTSYFVLWWCGAMAAEAYGRGDFTLRGIGSPLWWLAGLVAISLVVVWQVGPTGAAWQYPVLMLRHFGVGLLLLILAYTVVGRMAASWVSSWTKPASYLASISYGIYVFHMPLLVDWKFSDTWYGFSVALAMLIGLSIFFDRYLSKALPKI